MASATVTLGPDDHGEQVTVVLQFADVRRTYTLVGITVTAPDTGGEPLSAERLRRLPLGRMIRQGRQQLWRDQEALADAMDGPGAEWFRPEPPRPPGRGRQWTDELLQAVAEVYTDELRAPREPHRGARPRKAVAEDFHLSDPQASAVIRKARDAGLLGETQPGRAGGIPDDQTPAGTDPAAEQEER